VEPPGNNPVHPTDETRDQRCRQFAGHAKFRNLAAASRAGHRQFLPEPGIAAKRGGDPTGPVNFISNGGFEVATPAMNKFGSSSVLTQVTGPVHGGTTALQVTSSVSTAATPGFNTYRESRPSPPVGH
jgi:hypothetical protein